MKKTVYIETSVISYMISAPSGNIRISGHQIATHELWRELPRYQVFVSDTVVEEASCGDKEKARKRLELMHDFEVLEIDIKVQALANELVKAKTIPSKYPEDALHIAVAAVNGIDFILTWNFKHINNPFMMREISDVVTQAKYIMPVICSPEELLGGDYE